MAFSHVQGKLGTATSGHATVASVLTSAPTTGNLVCVVITAQGSITLNSVKDNASPNNSYTITPNSPSSANDGTAGSCWLAYLLSAPSNANPTITATFSANSVGTLDIWAEEFSVTGGSQTFDKDVIGSGTSGTTINTPSITPTNANSLLFSGASVENQISAPAAGATLGVWTGSAGGISASGNQAEYDLSASGATAVQYTQSSGHWDAMVMSFFISAGASVTFEDDSFNVVLVPPIEPTISVW
jgi:hypothetical protein